MFIRKKSQSVLEYALLIAVIIAAILIMQVFIKRGYSGRLKDSADRMGGGESYSAGSTTIINDSSMSGDQTIYEETATGEDTFINNFQTGLGDKLGQGAYSGTARAGGDVTSTMKSKTDGAAQEDFRSANYTQGVYDQGYDDFTDSDLDSLENN